ncbi:hypothetical protein B0T24DRAFT_602537 [Lasiosphaeria ovina]|uniref:Uncharacterized protein n=1 Tax=Lasiosphaeria ovina TaxID=92902 RepID=A0AAE0NJP7_9PEZI|nr:hypothetical protein B0T24DRAFT_602537 [Lasiosphaeria ovina]
MEPTYSSPQPPDNELVCGYLEESWMGVAQPSTNKTDPITFSNANDLVYLSPIAQSRRGRSKAKKMDPLPDLLRGVIDTSPVRRARPSIRSAQRRSRAHLSNIQTQRKEINSDTAEPYPGSQPSGSSQHPELPASEAVEVSSSQPCTPPRPPPHLQNVHANNCSDSPDGGQLPYSFPRKDVLVNDCSDSPDSGQLPPNFPRKHVLALPAPQSPPNASPVPPLSDDVVILDEAPRSALWVPDFLLKRGHRAVSGSRATKSSQANMVPDDKFENNNGLSSTSLQSETRKRHSYTQQTGVQDLNENEQDSRPGKRIKGPQASQHSHNLQLIRPSSDPRDRGHVSEDGSQEKSQEERSEIGVLEVTLEPPLRKGESCTPKAWECYEKSPDMQHHIGSKLGSGDNSYHDRPAVTKDRETTQMFKSSMATSIIAPFKITGDINVPKGSAPFLTISFPQLPLPVQRHSLQTTPERVQRGQPQSSPPALVNNSSPPQSRSRPPPTLAISADVFNYELRPSPEEMWKQAIADDSPPAVMHKIVNMLHRSLKSHEDSIGDIAKEYKNNALKLIRNLDDRHKMEKIETTTALRSSTRAVLATFTNAKRDTRELVEQMRSMTITRTAPTFAKLQLAEKVELLERLLNAKLRGHCKTTNDDLDATSEDPRSESGSASGDEETLEETYRKKLSMESKPSGAATRGALEEVDLFINEFFGIGGKKSTSRLPKPARKPGQRGPEVLEELVDGWIKSLQEPPKVTSSAKLPKRKGQSRPESLPDQPWDETALGKESPKA